MTYMQPLGKRASLIAPAKSGLADGGRADFNGTELRRFRVGLTWTQARLASEIAVHRGSVSRWERGRCRPCTASAKRLAALRSKLQRGTSERERLRRDIVERLAGRRVVASISGGKDSAAMSLYLTELGIEHERVFLDTGWESDLTYAYLRDELPRVLGPIRWVSAPRQMEDLIRHRGMFPSRLKRFCTQELKVFPMAAYLRSLLDAGHDVVNTVGIRAQESEARACLSEWEWEATFDCEVWRPLLRWTEAEVINIHKRHGLRPNPLYLLGASRVGCWPCIYARKSEIRLLAETDPARVVRLRVLESEVGEQAAERAARDGRSLACPPSWFQSRLSTRRPDGTRDGTCWPIDRVVAWSKTAFRGIGDAPSADEFLFSAQQDGCMRWGMCETAPPAAAVTGSSLGESDAVLGA